MKRRYEEDDTFTCPICFEKYETAGEKLPRIFPCTHTVCEKCITDITKNTELVCPKCRKKYRAANGAKSFPENPYIISTINIIEEKKEEEFESCKEHKRELSIFCNDESCMKAICQICFMKSHRDHNVVDRIEEHKKKLEIMLKTLSDNILLENLKGGKSKESLKALENMKRSSMVKFDRMIKEVQESIAVSESICQLMEEELEDALKMKTDLDETGRANPKEIESVDKILDENATKESRSCYLKYKASLLEGDVYGKLIEAEVSLPNSEVIFSIDMQPNHPVYTFQPLPNDTVIVCMEVRNYKRTVEEDNLRDQGTDDEEEKSSDPGIKDEETNQGTSEEEVNPEAQGIDNSSDPRSGQEGNSDEKDDNCEESIVLVQYALNGDKLFEKFLDEVPYSMTNVTLGNRMCLALSYSKHQKIDFRDINNLDEVLLSYSAAPLEPGRLSTEVAGTLLYVDRASKPLEVRRLDCSTHPPTQTEFITKTEIYDNIYFTGSAKHKTEKLSIFVGEDTAEAYRPDSTKVWRIGGALPGLECAFNPYGVVADDHDHLLVCDKSNNCVRMFSLDDGSHMGVVLSAEQGIDRPYDISRCNSKSIFIIQSNDHSRLDFVKIETDGVKENAECVSFEDKLAEEQCTGYYHLEKT